MILAWGSRRLCVFRIEILRTPDGSLDGVTTTQAGYIALSDWILDAIFVPAVSDDTVRDDGLASGGWKVIAVTAHNALFKVGTQDTDVHNDTSPQCLPTHERIQQVSVAQLRAGSRTICYSAHLQWLSDGKILIAAGTAFGDVTMYTYDFEDGRVLEITTFSAHEGSIFGVRLSEPVLPALNQPPTRLLATCSDDRTIRIWDITYVAIDEHLASMPTNTVNGIVTGFKPVLDNGASLDDSLRPNLIASTMAHGSRVWSVHFLPQQSSQRWNPFAVGLASIGEDAVCLSWQLLRVPPNSKSLSPTAWTLNQLSTATIHSGKNVWSIATAERARPLSHEYLILTGGADGSIYLHTHKQSSGVDSRREKLQWLVELDSPICVSTSSRTHSSHPIISKSREDLVRSYAFLRDGSFIFTTNTGRLFLSKVTPSIGLEDLPRAFTHVETFDNLRGYSVAAGLPTQNIVFFAGAHGTVRCYDGDDGSVFDVIPARHMSGQKIARLFAEDVASSCFQDVVILTVTFVPALAPQTVLLERRPGSEWSISKPSPCNIPQHYLGREITSSLTTLERGLLLQFLGFRNGCIVVLASASPFSEDESLTYSTTLEKAHGRDAVTGMRWIPKTRGDGGWLYSVGRNGCLTVHRFDQPFWDCPTPRNPPSLVHQLPVPLGKDLEGLYVAERTNELLIYGFHSTSFVLYDVTMGQEVVSIECGGAHRTWQFDIHRSSESGRVTGGNLLWTKASESNLFSIDTPSTRCVRRGFHGREIKACAIASQAIDGSSFGPLVATGSEGTDIRLMYLSDRGDDGSDGDFRCVGTIRKHDTGIQSLKWSTSGRYLFSSGGCEEFYVWQVSAAPILGVGVSCESSLPVQGKRSEQRISDFAVLVETETESEVQFQLTLVYSNSFIKTYRYKRDDVGEHWALICQTQYTTACLTAVDAIRIDTAALLLIGATDGHVSIWAETAAGGSSCQLSSPRCINLHQNSVKTMSIAQLSPTTALVLAGGDDNAISFTLIRGTRGYSEMSTTSVVMPRAHAASVTASALFIQIPPSNGENKFRLRAMTSGNDQRIKIWDIDINLGLPDADAISVKRTANQASAVADISAIAVFPGVDGGKEGCVQNAKKLLVCGVGFEVWNLSK